jgi:hypothetical protein
MKLRMRGGEGARSLWGEGAGGVAAESAFRAPGSGLRAGLGRSLGSGPTVPGYSGSVERERERGAGCFGSGVFGGEGVAVGAGDFVEEGAEGFDFFGLGGGEVLGFGGVVFEVKEFGGEGGVLA